MTPRRLIALNVNDRDHLSDSAYRAFLDVRNAQSVGAVQQALRSQRSRSADLFLIDVDMQHSDNPSDLEWGGSELRPYGPLLALPFLDASSISAFVPYSNYWGYPRVSSNGFVVVAVSLLLSQMHGRPFSLSETKAEIEASVMNGRGLVNEAETALARCLTLYRERIEQDKRVQLVDVEAVMERLQDLENEAIRENSWPVEVPFADAEGLLGVDVHYPDSPGETIQLGSLFADILEFRRPKEPEDLVPLYEILERWKPCSTNRWGGTLYSSVLEALERCASGIAINKTAKDTPFVRKTGSLYQVIRIAMEFAWVRAWHQEGVPDRRIKLVHQLLGLEKGGVVLPTASNLYKRFLGVTTNGVVKVSNERWREGFWPDASGALSATEAYKLDRNQPSTLTPFERALCAKFAMEELQWNAQGDAAKQLYPQWMA